MAVYKVPQDVEADDKFLGPLCFKQFLFAGGAVICAYLSFLTITRGVWFITPVFLLPGLGLTALAAPWSKDQPTELWLAARIRFFLKPRKRIWDQSGVKDLVQVNAPPKVAHLYTDGLSQTEVKSRLNALATMVDSRGWAVKNVASSIDDSDRLTSAAIAPPDEDQIKALDVQDVFDDSSGDLAQHFDAKIVASEEKHKSDTMKLVEDARNRAQQADNQDAKEEQFWLSDTKQPDIDPSLRQSTAGYVQNDNSQAQQQQMTDDELLERAHELQKRRKLQGERFHQRQDYTTEKNPSRTQTSPPKRTQKTDNKPPVTTEANTDILNLAQSNDLNVETIARQANKKDNSDDGEVVISLH